MIEGDWVGYTTMKSIKRFAKGLQSLQKYQKYLNYASHYRSQEKFFILYILPDLWSKLLYYNMNHSNFMVGNH